MANQNITFDVASGTPYESNLTINGGANFSNIFTVTNPNGTAFNFTDYSGSSQMIRSMNLGLLLVLLVVIGDGILVMIKVLEQMEKVLNLLKIKLIKMYCLTHITG